MTIDRSTVRAYTAYGWAEVIRRAREELVRNSPAATPAEARYLGLPVLMEWIDPDGSEGSSVGVLVAIEQDGDRRWAVTDEGLGVNMDSADFTLRLAAPDWLFPPARG